MAENGEDVFTCGRSRLGDERNPKGGRDPRNGGLPSEQPEFGESLDRCLALKMFEPLHPDDIKAVDFKVDGGLLVPTVDAHLEHHFTSGISISQVHAEFLPIFEQLLNNWCIPCDALDADIRSHGVRKGDGEKSGAPSLGLRTDPLAVDNEVALLFQDADGITDHSCNLGNRGSFLGWEQCCLSGGSGG